jgi:hypothetical protein
MTAARKLSGEEREAGMIELFFGLMNVLMG